MSIRIPTIMGNVIVHLNIAHIIDHKYMKLHIRRTQITRSTGHLYLENYN